MMRLQCEDSPSELNNSEVKEVVETEDTEDKKTELTSVVEKESKGEKIKFGERLLDDLINSFCDKLQATCPRKIEGLLAIQSLMVSDIDEIRNYLTGENAAFQVIFERKRAHYVLVHYNPIQKYVILYDSLQRFNKNGSPIIYSETAVHICNLFGHLYEEFIPIVIDGEYEIQTDHFSCGYRVIGALIDINRNKNPSEFTYNRIAIMEFMNNILNEQKPKWELFENVNIGEMKEYKKNRIFGYPIANVNYNSSSDNSMNSIEKPIEFENHPKPIYDNIIDAEENIFERVSGGGGDEIENEDFLDKAFTFLLSPTIESSIEQDQENNFLGHIKKSYHYLMNGFSTKPDVKL